MCNYERNEFDECTVWREAFPIDETKKGLDVLSLRLNDSSVFGATSSSAASAAFTASAASAAFAAAAAASAA